MPQVESSGVTIHFEVEGQGFPVVLHTGGGGDGTMWREGGYVEGLEGFQCILMDHRGHGRSGKPHGVANHRLECYAGDVIAVLDALNIERAAFWGYSGGSSVGYALAARYPERVTALIATGAIGSRDYNDPREREEVVEAADAVRRHGVGHLIEGMQEAEGIDFPAWFWQQMNDTDREMFALQLLGAAEWQGPWSLLPQVHCPVLMLVGETEDPDGDNPRAASILPDGRCVTFPGLGHVGAYLHSELALAEAVPFLRAIETSVERG